MVNDDFGEEDIGGGMQQVVQVEGAKIKGKAQAQ